MRQLVMAAQRPALPRNRFRGQYGGGPGRFVGSYPPDNALGNNGDFFTCNGNANGGYRYDGCVFKKVGGIWTLFQPSEAHVFDWASWMGSSKNPMLYFHMDTRIPFSLSDDSTGAIQGNDGINQTGAFDYRVDGTAADASASLVWGTREYYNGNPQASANGVNFGQGSYNSEPGWIQQQHKSSDQVSHNSGVYRAGPSFGKKFDPQQMPSVWFWFEDLHPSSIGLDQFAVSTTSDNVLRWQIHGPSVSQLGYEHTDSPYIAEHYGTSPTTTGGWHVYNVIDHQAYTASRWHQTDKPTWSDSPVSGSYTNGITGTSEANWKSQLGAPVANVVKVVWGYTTGRVIVWRKYRDGTILKALDYTGNVGPDPTTIIGLGGDTSNYANLKFDWYYYNQRAGWTQLRTMLRNLRCFSLGDTILTNMGYTTDDDRAHRMLQSAQSNNTP